MAGTRGEPEPVPPRAVARGNWRALLLALLLGGVAGALAIVFLRSSIPAPDARPVAEDPDIGPERIDDIAPVAKTDGTLADAGNTPAALAELPLPPLEAPLADVIDDLRRRSEAGDGKASCRLAAELAACTQQARQQAHLAGYLARRQQEIGNETDAELRDALVDETELLIQAQQAHLDASASHCADVEPASGVDIARLWRRSALQGSAVGLRTYASGNAFAWESMMDQLPELTRFRAEAETLAMRAVQQGDFDMLLALASAYAPQTDIQRMPGLLAQVVQSDPVKALAMFRHARDLVAADAGEGAAELLQRIQLRIQAIEDVTPPGESDRADRYRQSEIAAWTRPTLRGLARISASGDIVDTFRGWCGR